MSYARCDWSVTVLISGYANTVVTSQHVSQFYFIKEIENGRLCLYNLMQTRAAIFYFLNISCAKCNLRKLVAQSLR